MNEIPKLGQSAAVTTSLFAFVSVVSAFLLFIVEPLCGKALLPAFGGGPALWNSCVVFFQVALLVGYLGAHLLGKISRVRTQACIYVTLLGAGYLLLPFHFDPGDPSLSDYPALSVLAVLTQAIGLPVFVLCAAAPTLQSWLARGFQLDPYRLYAASNAGSLCGLLAYPFLIEWTLGLHSQAVVWQFGYAVLILLFASLGYLAARAEQVKPEAPALPRFELPRSRALVTWISLSAAPSALLVAVTSYITTDIAPVPLFWVLPLVIYLATFILAFRKEGFSITHTLERCFILLAIALQVIIAMEASQPALLLICMHLACLFLGSLLCHSELARSRPDVSLLTTFYLAISVGGVLGGIFSTLIAPILFTKLVEYPFLLAVILLAYGFCSDRNAARRSLVVGFVSVLSIATLFSLFILPLVAPHGEGRAFLPVAFAVPAIVCLYFSASAWQAGWSLLALFFGALLYSSTHGSEVFRYRSFYGTLRVAQPAGKNEMALVHGHVVHGRQSLTERSECVPLGYYHQRGPAGEFFTAFQASHTPDSQHVAVVGLGAGALACYARSQEEWQFFELDPGVDMVARDEKYFTFLRNARTPIHSILGDARLKLESLPDHSVSLLVLDAFSSDSVPVHLLTKEAFDVYRRKLKPHGYILAHISNQFLDLTSVLADLSVAQNWSARLNDDRVIDPLEPRKDASTWVLLGQNEVDVEVLRLSAHWKPLTTLSPAEPWSDDFSNIVQVLNWRR